MTEKLEWKWKRKVLGLNRLIKKTRFEFEETEKKARFEMEENDKKAGYDLELRKLEAAERGHIRKHELRTKGIQVDEVGHPEDTDSFRMSSAIKFVTKFQEHDLEQLLLNFEKSMEIHNFPKDKWTPLIHTKLTGKAQKVFAELGVEACLNYDTLKAALLLAYERVPEFHRKRFRTLNKFGNETYSTFTFRLALPFNSWMDGEEASTDINRLKEVMKLEQFTNCLPTEIHRWVVEKRPKLLVDAAKLADEYAVLYKPFHAEQDNSWKSDDRNFSDKPEKTFHKNGGRGTFHQKYHHKGNNNHKTAVPVTKN